MRGEGSGDGWRRVKERAKGDGGRRCEQKYQDSELEGLGRGGQIFLNNMSFFLMLTILNF